MRLSTNELRRDTLGLIREIDKQIEQIKIDFGLPKESPPASARDKNGNYPLIPLLQAKSTALNTLVLLQTQGTR